MQGMTKRQKQIVDFIKNFIETHSHSPSYGEIKDFFKFSSIGSVYNHVQALKRKNILSGGRGARSLFLNSELTAGSIEVPLVGKIKGSMPIEMFSKFLTIALPVNFLPSEGEYYFLQVEGHELNEEMIQSRDLLLVKPTSHFIDGEIVLVLIDDQATLIKKAFDNPPFVRLESVNPNVNALILRKSDVKIQGIIVTLLRNYTEGMLP